MTILKTIAVDLDCMKDNVVTALMHLDTVQGNSDQASTEFVSTRQALHASFGVALSLIDRLGELASEDAPPSVSGKSIIESLAQSLSDVPPTPSNLKTLNEDQSAALVAIKSWIKNRESHFFVVRGPAGTGKSTLMSHVKHIFPSVIPTALTNKACRVLSRMLGERAPCKTIYSALGLVMSESEGELVLTKSDRPPPIIPGSVYLVDECSMINKLVLKEIAKAAEVYDVQFILVGDAFQLPPVGEQASPVWRMDSPKAVLKQVMRFDSSLLQLSLAIRDRIKNKQYTNINALFVNSAEISVLPARDFKREMVDAAVAGRDTCGLAWTNRQVENYNQAIREALGFQGQFEVGDRLMLAAPVERLKNIVATIDDAVRVDAVVLEQHRIYLKNEAVDIEVYTLQVSGDWKGELHVPSNPGALDKMLQGLANKAKNAESADARRVRWSDFWAVKKGLDSVRYAYAMTCHRSQGSTVEETYVDVANIMRNQSEREMLKCLYVACTRASRRLIVNLGA